MLKRCSLFFLILLPFVLFSGCKSTSVDGLVTDAAKLVNVDQASRAYVHAGDLYESTMIVLVKLRASRKADGTPRISDEQWDIIEAYSRRIGDAGQHAGRLLQLWRAGGIRGEFNAAYTELVSNVNGLQAEAAKVN